MSPFKWGDDLFLKNSLLLFTFHFLWISSRIDTQRFTSLSDKNTSSCPNANYASKASSIFYSNSEVQSSHEVLSFEFWNFESWRPPADRWLSCKKTGKINYFLMSPVFFPPSENSLSWKNFKHRQYFRLNPKRHEKHRRLSERHSDITTQTQSPGFESPVLPIVRRSLKVGLWNKIQK